MTRFEIRAYEMRGATAPYAASSLRKQRPITTDVCGCNQCGSSLRKTEISGYGPSLSRGRRMRLNARPRTHGHRLEKFQAGKNLFPETALLASRSSARQRCGGITRSN